MVPVSGSAYTYSYVAFGELFAWIIGWALVLEYAVGNMAVAVSWTGSIKEFGKLMGFEVPAMVVQNTIDTVSTKRSALGASQNRLEHTIANLGVAQENLTASESRIRDVDIAFETADLTRNSIMQQAAIAILSQANVQPQLALELL